MKQNWRPGARRAFMLASLSLCAACQSGGKVDPAALAKEAERVEAFNSELAGSTQAVNAGDLDLARGRLDAAAALAAKDSEREKIETLDRFLIGAEALLIGDVQLASLEWSHIDDPALGPELREKARLIGMTVPDAPDAPDAPEGSEDE